MSRIIDILTAIKNGTAYTKNEQSRVEAILSSIANQTEYIGEALSRHEELLNSIKAGTNTTIVPRTRIEEILVAIANGTLSNYLDSKNLFVTEFEYGSISTSTGNGTASTTKLRNSGIVNVSPNTTYNFSLEQSQNLFGVLNIHAYDQSGNWLGARSYFGLSALGTTTTEFAFETPSDVYGIRLVLTVYGDDEASIDIANVAQVKMLLLDFQSELEKMYVNAFGGA